MDQVNHPQNIFLNKAEDYVKYEQTQRGRLRSELLFWQLESWLKKNTIKTVLDIGCGIGSFAIRLSKLGYKVTAIDPEESMLEKARKNAAKENSKMTILQGNIEDIDKLPGNTKFDLVICHNVLQFLKNPNEALGQMQKILTPNGILSLEVRSPVGQVFYNAFATHQFPDAKEAIQEPLKNSSTGVRSNFTLDSFTELLKSYSLEPISTYGMRIFFDYLPDAIAEDFNNFDSLLDLEKASCAIMPYKACGRYIHAIVKNSQ